MRFAGIAFFLMHICMSPEMGLMRPAQARSVLDVRTPEVRTDSTRIVAQLPRNPEASILDARVSYCRRRCGCIVVQATSRSFLRPSVACRTLARTCLLHTCARPWNHSPHISIDVDLSLRPGSV